MATEVERARFIKRMTDEFASIEPSGTPIDVHSALRQAHALEYIAFHLGRISRALEQGAGAVPANRDAA
jgi:hypothetical protein